MDNHMLKDIMLDLIKYCDKNRIIILKVNIDLNDMILEATIYHNEEAQELRYNGAQWIKK